MKKICPPCTACNAPRTNNGHEGLCEPCERAVTLIGARPALAMRVLTKTSATDNRPSRDGYYMALARVVATRSTCIRRAVGCVLVDAVGRVLSTGYNGRSREEPHCNERVLNGEDYVQDKHDPSVEHPQRLVYMYPNACAGSTAQSGTALDACDAVHAEQNAMSQCCVDPMLIAACYVTTLPCVPCAKLLLNTGCKRLVFAEPYAGLERIKELWTPRRELLHFVS